MSRDTPWFGECVPAWTRWLFPTYYVGLLLGASVIALICVLMAIVSTPVALCLGAREGFRWFVQKMD